MAAAMLWGGPIFIRDATGAAVSGALITVNQAGLSTPAVVYHDSDLSEPWTQPIECNSNGSPGGPVFVSPTPSLDVTVTDADEVPLPDYETLNWTPYVLES